MFRQALRRRHLVAGVVVLGLGMAGAAFAQRADGTAEIHVTLLDGKLSVTSPVALVPGPLTLVAANRGRFPHALAIRGPGLPTKRTVEIASGKTATLTVNLVVGRYTLWDPVLGDVSDTTILNVSAGKTPTSVGSSIESGQSTWGTGPPSSLSSNSSSGDSSGDTSGTGVLGPGCGYVPA